jgi:hypothetical protein
MNSLIVTEIIARSIENGCKEMLRKGIRMCAEKYGFSAEEALINLEIDSLKLERKVMRRSKGKKSKMKEIPMPFSREMVNEECCSGLRYNGGLYTQCENKGCDGGYCGNCSKEGIENGTGIPDNGNLEGRLKVDLMDYKDPKGRSPKEYLKILKKLNISEEEAKAEAGKKNYIIDNMHFSKKEKKAKKEVVVGLEVEVEVKKGRPKKEKKEIVSKKEEVKDLFAELVEETIENKVEEVVVKKVEFVEEVVKKEEKKVKSEKKSEEKKAQEKAAKEAEKEEKKAQEKAAKEAEKEEKKAQEKAAKEAEKKNKVELEEKVEERKKVTVTRFEFEGNKYLKSSENILYDADTKEEKGIWCEDTKSIKPLPEDDEEEEEEEEEYED